MTRPPLSALLARLEQFYDAVPRDGARVEVHGPLVLFVQDGARYPFYARPTLGAPMPPTVADITAMRVRQRALGVPEAFEWVDETTPSLRPVAEAAGLVVLRAPLMLLDPAALPAKEAIAALVAVSAEVRLLAPSEPGFAAELAACRAVARVGFGAPGTAAGEAGPRARDAVLLSVEPAEVVRETERIRGRRAAFAIAALPGEGAVASGMIQRVGGVAEIVGVATLPSLRRRGLGAAVTAALARHTLETGAELVFLSAGSEMIARVYERVGFQRVGTACIAEGMAE